MRKVNLGMRLFIAQLSPSFVIEKQHRSLLHELYDYYLHFAMHYKIMYSDKLMARNKRRRRLQQLVESSICLDSRYAMACQITHGSNGNIIDFH